MDIPESTLEPFGYTGMPTLFSTAQYMTIQESEEIMQACDNLMRSLTLLGKLSPPDPEGIRIMLAHRALRYGAQWARCTVSPDARDVNHFIFVVSYGRLGGVEQTYAVSTKRHAV